MCGILDNLGNKLCYPQYLDCPLNYITTNISDCNYTKYESTKLKNKTVYFTNEATENGKVIGGLFVDSDLMIKYNDEDCEILEEGIVNDLLDTHPYKLYKNSLSFDPYNHRTDVVQRGKSYLKWCIPGYGKEKDISKIKELKVEFDFNITTNKEIISSVKIFSSASYFVCLPGYIGLFLSLIIFIFAFNEQNDIYFHKGGFFECLNSINFLILFLLVLLSTLVLFGTIFACEIFGNISAGNKLDLKINIFGILKSFDIAIICMNFALIILLFIFILYLFYTPKTLPEQEKITQNKTYKDNKKTKNECADFKNNNNIDDYYKSSDFINNNNKDDYYNSSDFNNNLLNNQPQQTSSGL